MRRLLLEVAEETGGAVPVSSSPAASAARFLAQGGSQVRLHATAVVAGGAAEAAPMVAPRRRWVTCARAPAWIMRSRAGMALFFCI